MAAMFQIRSLKNGPRQEITEPLESLFADLVHGDRLKDFRRAFIRMTGDKMLKEVKLRLPKGAEYKEYRKALRISKVTGTGDDETVAVHAVAPKDRAAGVADERKTAIFVEYVPGQKAIRRKKYVSILREFNPWTADTLPISPAPSEAKLVFKDVGRREHEEVANARKRDMPNVRKLLAGCGIRVAPKLPGKFVGNSDLVFLAMRLEFGIGIQHREHWKPSLRKVRQEMQRVWSSDDWVRKWLWDPKFHGWNREPKALIHISSEDAKSLSDFEAKVRI